MDRSLDDIVSDRHQRGPPRRGGQGQYNDRARDPPRKSRDAPTNLDRDWVHDRYEVDDYSRPNPRDTRPPPRGARFDRYEPELDRPVESSAKLRVDNVHYELYENDLKELFERIGPVTTVQILYDRSDRSKGIAYVTYTSYQDAQRALREYNGANAYGQPISLTLMPTGPAAGRGAGGGGRSLDERISAPERSLFDRIEGGISRGGGRGGRGDEGGRSRARRSESPRDRERMRRSDVARSAPEHIDRYVPGERRDDRRRDRERSRSPMRRGQDRRGGGGGRRGGRRGDGDDGRGDRGPRAETEGRGTRGGRPRKTADELDAEMEDYWGSAGGDGVQRDEVAGGAAAGAGGVAAEPIGGGGAAVRDDMNDVDMIE